MAVTTATRILMVENHATFAEVVTRRFLADVEVTRVGSVVAAKDALLRRAFDAALVDYDLDDGKGDAFVTFALSFEFEGRIIAISSHEAGNAALLRAGAHAACPKAQFARIREVLGLP